VGSRPTAPLSMLVALVASLAVFHGASAAHAGIGTPVDNPDMPTLAGGKARALGDGAASVLVFFRPNQDNSVSALRDLAACEAQFAGKPVRWAAVVSASAPADSAAALITDAKFSGPVLVDTGDALYGSLGISLHPVVVIVDRDHKLAAFEAFRSVDFCTIVVARIRYALHEISSEELQRVLDPPAAAEGGNNQVARRYRALAQALFNAGDRAKATEYARKSIEHDPQLAGAHALLGDILAAEGKCPEAMTAFNAALAIDSGNAEAGAGLARCKAAPAP
jgi:tetratricopeptide (TPR) repeat protein